MSVSPYSFSLDLSSSLSTFISSAASIAFGLGVSSLQTVSAKEPINIIEGDLFPDPKTDLDIVEQTMDSIWQMPSTQDHTKEIEFLQKKIDSLKEL